jgi:hypothetical protein
VTPACRYRKRTSAPGGLKVDRRVSHVRSRLGGHAQPLACPEDAIWVGFLSIDLIAGHHRIEVLQQSGRLEQHVGRLATRAGEKPPSGGDHEALSTHQRFQDRAEW